MFNGSGWTRKKIFSFKISSFQWKLFELKLSNLKFFTGSTTEAGTVILSKILKRVGFWGCSFDCLWGASQTAPLNRTLKNHTLPLGTCLGLLIWELWKRLQWEWIEIGISRAPEHRANPSGYPVWYRAPLRGRYFPTNRGRGEGGRGSEK